ncbi:Uncharacterized protein TCM_038292 [Theobroma cacao]|uniref:Uncharacterized protein n=1 Tax=Theobroma cacao TaxID=3641 RepID=A0A061GPL2_THECC|nr:Uncharacterized protein TCM_038292 [Theobroma cacao]
MCKQLSTSDSRRDNSKKLAKVGEHNPNSLGLESRNRFADLTERFSDSANEEVTAMKEATSGESPNVIQRPPSKFKLKNVAKPSLQRKQDQLGIVNFKVVEPVIIDSHGELSKLTFQAGTSLVKA